MKTTRLFMFLILLSVSFPVLTQVRNDTLNYLIQTRGKNRYIGKIISEDVGKILLLSRGDTIAILPSEIVSREQIKGGTIKKGLVWKDNQLPTKYFLSQNGYGLKKGTGYYHNAWLLFNQVAYGLTDHLSIAASIMPFSFLGFSAAPVSGSAKISIPIVKDKINISASALGGTLLGQSGTFLGFKTGKSHAIFGSIASITTIGSRNNNLSIGGGLVFWGGDSDNAPYVSFDALLRLARNFSFISENYLFFNHDISDVYSLTGVRWIISNKAAVDLGITLPFAEDMNPSILIGINLPFGKNQ
jgi:hypothetical protein